ncbi:4-(cytidine 5'-diphospho)-2-C-methyl-D-erythritol kinase [Roseibium sp.]|uniref:4-(cytidine 5'-diphospho)-2-C-methyl-D-erythritol kinase n=1 Tax=Roseibium sp. TaxID=1936156 RepID=UPI003A9699E8
MTAQTTQQMATDLARAKVNLALHITGRRGDGYHLLDSLVVFPNIGDQLKACPSEALSLEIDGPFATPLASGGSDNLVTTAIRKWADAAGISAPPLKIHLTKNLPVASGIGGGSADAAAALRLAQRLGGTQLPRAQLQALALDLGADVPVCLMQEPTRMEGIGERLSPLPSLPEFGMVLVNPGVAVSTPAIFKGLDARDNPPLPPLPDYYANLDDLIAYLQTTRNDMQATAERLCPQITSVLDALGAAPGSKFTRMSGSGATCFALCNSGAEEALARSIQKSHPDWWVASSAVSGQFRAS